MQTAPRKFPDKIQTRTFILGESANNYPTVQSKVILELTNCVCVCVYGGGGYLHLVWFLLVEPVSNVEESLEDLDDVLGALFGNGRGLVVNHHLRSTFPPDCQTLLQGFRQDWNAALLRRPEHLKGSESSDQLLTAMMPQATPLRPRPPQQLDTCVRVEDMFKRQLVKYLTEAELRLWKSHIWDDFTETGNSKPAD